MSLKLILGEKHDISGCHFSKPMEKWQDKTETSYPIDPCITDTTPPPTSKVTFWFRLSHPNYPNFSAANRRLSHLLQPTNDVASTLTTITFRQNPQDLSREAIENTSQTDDIHLLYPNIQ
ncbi:hypothetical protein TNCV_4625611 [Trichonephila clavipes]|nr:hypothetical protein TNCV_4625611 [Trichonephila clavipes]